jgi:hypothetical protein
MISHKLPLHLACRLWQLPRQLHRFSWCHRPYLLPLYMPAIRLQALPKQSNSWSASCALEGVHIRIVRHHWGYGCPTNLDALKHRNEIVERVLGDWVSRMYPKQALRWACHQQLQSYSHTPNRMHGLTILMIAIWTALHRDPSIEPDLVRIQPTFG